jgi:acetyl esterase/lipase
MGKGLEAAGVALVCAACSGARDVRVEHGVVYDERYRADVMDVYVPDDGASARPGVMIVHGGSWREGGRKDHADHARRFAEAGYVAVSIDYRLVPDGAYPGMMRDVACAFARLQERADEYGLDPARIATMGYSAGGHLVSLLGVAGDELDFAQDCGAAMAAFPPAATISGAGPQDLREWTAVGAVIDLLGDADEFPERYELASPITHVSASAPPLLMIHGTDDLVVPIDQSRDMRDAMREAGAEARLLELYGAGHVVGPGGPAGDQEIPVLSVDTPEAWIAIVDFLDDTVGAP